jgi:hypothetical protein
MHRSLDCARDDNTTGIQEVSHPTGLPFTRIPTPTSRSSFRFAQAGLKPCPAAVSRLRRFILVASLQPALSAILLVRPSGSCCSGLDARGRRERRYFLSLRENRFKCIYRGHNAKAPVAAASARVDGLGLYLDIVLRRHQESARSLTPAHALMTARVR